MQKWEITLKDASRAVPAAVVGQRLGSAQSRLSGVQGRVLGTIQHLSAPGHASEENRLLAERLAMVLDLNRGLEQRMAERTAELEAANRELEAFSYSVAHDLRSSLAALGCFGQMLETSDGHGLTERGKHFLQRIRFSAAQMDSMTTGLLELARLSKTAVRPCTVDLAPIAQQLFDDLAAQEPGRQARILVDRSMAVRGDAVLLTQLLSNLIGNAWKFSAARELTRIEVGSSVDDVGARVHFVRDNGAGFDMAHAGCLFEVFQRLHSASEYAGTGIGLATVRRIVARHNGRIWAQAEPGHGATFFFTLAQAAQAFSEASVPR